MTLPFTAHAKASDLSSALRFVAIAIAKKPPVAMLAGVMLTAHDHGIVLSAYDYETSASITIPGSGEGSILASHAQFTSVLKAFGKNDTISLDGDFTDGMHLNSDGFGAVVEIIAHADYPELPDIGAEIAHISDPSVLNDVLTAVCKDPALPALCGVQIVTEPSTGGITMAATDRYRLVEAAMNGAHDLLDPSSAIVPWKVCAHVAKSFKDGCLMHGTRTGYGFSDATKSLTVRAIDAAFPRYHGLIPSEDSVASAVVDSGALIAAVKRVQAAMPKGDLMQGAAVEFLPDGVWIGSLRIPAKVDGDSFTARLSPTYLIDALLAVGPGEVTISTYAPKLELPMGLRPVMFTNDRGVRALVMPITPSAS